ncbi:MAG: hypothetical protein KF734_21785 [Saprospiraceae bacterium]|nr:hypothetical protein [Saprospiraceae bacterium]
MAIVRRNAVPAFILPLLAGTTTAAPISRPAGAGVCERGCFYRHSAPPGLKTGRGYGFLPIFRPHLVGYSALVGVLANKKRWNEWPGARSAA